MARRRKSDTAAALEIVLWLIIGVPVALFIIIKWLFSAFLKIGQKTTLHSATVQLEDVDRMDGWSFEQFIAQVLCEKGYKKVCVTPGSGDFGVDITAYKCNQKWAFQCKNYQSKLGVAPIQEVYSGAPKYNAQICVVVTNSYFTLHAQELAKSLNVILWDREDLAKLLHSTSQGVASSVVETVQEHNKSKSGTTELKENEQEEYFMATQLSAGKYIFGVNVPEGTYNLKAISGSGMLQIQKLIDGTWDEEWINFGVDGHCSKTYHGLSLPKNKYFEVTGNVIFEITKATMLEIE